MFRFPQAIFPPSAHCWYLAGSAMIGGQPISGAPQSADNSAGGWWCCDYQVAILRTLEQIGVYRAIVGQLNSGVTLIEMPVLDALQPYPPGADRLLRGSAGGTVADITVDDIDAVLAADAFMPAWPLTAVPPTQAKIQMTIGGQVAAGQYFSVIGPSGSVRLHLITEVTASVGQVSTVNVVPPFREDMAAGTVVDFNNPRCTMKVDLASVRDAWPTMSPPFISRPKIGFAESGYPGPSF